MKISILVPSRGRPEKLQDMIFSALAMSSEGPEKLENQVEFVVYLDNDDPADYGQLETNKNFKGFIKVIRGPRIVLSEMWNRCYEQATGEIFMHAGDDLLFRTKNWDRFVVEEFEKYPDRIVFVHGDDGANKRAFGTHGFIHRNWVQTVGYFVPPFYSSDYNDTHLNDVSNMISRRVFVPILTEHMHFLFGKGEKDQTHIDRLERGSRDNVRDIYFSPEKLAGRKEDARKLQEFIKNYAN